LNLGDDIIYSGTVAGASEAGFTRHRGIAFSCPRYDFSGFEKYFDVIMQYILSSIVYRDNLILNINIPSNAKGIMVTRQGSYPFDTHYTLREDGRYHPEGTYANVENEESTDVASYFNNYISVTPLTVDRTDYTKLRESTEKVEF
jgi:5'-nucleotidase